ncbi:MAG: JAB-like toxin 1 domain-containing protein [Tissierellia bacterium]|nr:JAB-like toxin 1 domain-containing protein [Tissierellia bacterium]
MSNSDAAKVFVFASDNSSIEFGFIGTKNSGSVVFTNHTEGKIRASSTATKMNKEGKIITEITHNHPKNSDPSGSDKLMLENFLNRKVKTLVIMFISLVIRW